ncbi:hypothetical protein [Tenacibaculum sp. M341]|uniref:hypothetical protein n=1 Tax=Tenacibaculum sp. M341 TaxID=2530339 RepID=UPI00104F6476|nr:hypothetical protein [Tenacibaculum sp. M341]TCI85575.1 hypothetical protein EYW44_16585 [Tenacibaculum sp. M341]
MEIIIVFILLLINLSVITYQDFKERQVVVLLFVSAILLGLGLFALNANITLLLVSIKVNLLVILAVFLTLYVYAKFKMKMKLSETIGLGDAFFFIFLACSFPIITFLTLFSTSLIFSLILFLILKSGLKDKTVPLAGLQSLFVAIVLLINKLFDVINLYAI